MACNQSTPLSPASRPSQLGKLTGRYNQCTLPTRHRTPGRVKLLYAPLTASPRLSAPLRHPSQPGKPFRQNQRCKNSPNHSFCFPEGRTGSLIALGQRLVQDPLQPPPPRHPLPIPPADQQYTALLHSHVGGFRTLDWYTMILLFWLARQGNRQRVGRGNTSNRHRRAQSLRRREKSTNRYKVQGLVAYAAPLY